MRERERARAHTLLSRASFANYALISGLVFTPPSEGRKKHTRVLTLYAFTTSVESCILFLLPLLFSPLWLPLSSQILTKFTRVDENKYKKTNMEDKIWVLHNGPDSPFSLIHTEKTSVKKHPQTNKIENQLWVSSIAYIRF